MNNKAVVLRCEKLTKSFLIEGDQLPVLNDLSFSLYESEFLIILGQSGCGKTTLLRLIGGFETPDSGQILLHEKCVTTPSKQIMMVFQNYDQLFPWFTLMQNLIYAMRKTGITKDVNDLKDRAMRMLQLTKLEGFENVYPAVLSGGMKQRGALARALVLQPDLLLLDEPFSSLDALTRTESQDLLQMIRQETRIPLIMVTHDIDEGLALGDRIAILSKKEKKFSLLYKNTGTLSRSIIEKNLLSEDSSQWTTL